MTPLEKEVNESGFALWRVAAAQFGCSVHYLRNLCRSGKVRYTAVSSRRWLVNMDSLAQFFEQGEQVEPESVNGVRRINAGGKVG